jgi:hypothetical protein
MREVSAHLMQYIMETSQRLDARSRKKAQKSQSADRE